MPLDLGTADYTTLKQATMSSHSHTSPTIEPSSLVASHIHGLQGKSITVYLACLITTRAKLWNGKVPQLIQFM